MDIYRMLLHIYLICLIVDVNGLFERKCHNYYYGEKPKCWHLKNDSMDIIPFCKLCADNGKDYNLTLCYTEEFKTTFTDIFNAIPNTTEYLLIDFNNRWNGFLPLQPDPIDISAISRLQSLKYFQISDNRYQYYQLYPIKVQKSSFGNLKNLTTLRIRIPLIDNQNVSIAEIVEMLPTLHFLDLSYTRGLGAWHMLDILRKINRNNIKHLCLRKVQLPGARGYESDFAENIINHINFTFDVLEELDISDNTIARISPFISRIAPILKYLDISGNTLLDGSNLAFLFESFLHPTLEVLNANYQGKDSQPSKYIPPSKNSNVKLMQQSSGKDLLRLRQQKFLLNCVNTVFSGNISSGINNNTLTCKLVKCVLPTLFGDSICDENNVYPKLTEVLDEKCISYMKIPIGTNLKVFYFSHIHLEEAETVGASVSGNLCLHENNSLTDLVISHNYIWMKSAQLGNLFSQMTGITNFHQLKYVDTSYNNMTMKFEMGFNASLNNVKFANFAGNVVGFSRYCQSLPEVTHLNLSHTNIKQINASVLANCNFLKDLDLSYNNIQGEYINNLHFSEAPNLAFLHLQENNISVLKRLSLDRLDLQTKLKINLYNNPLHCNCSEEAQYFTRWLHKKGNNTLIKYKHYYCSGPGGLTFIHEIKDIDNFWKSCNSNNTEIIVISIISSFGFSTLIGFLFFLYKIRWRLRYYIFKIPQSCSVPCKRKQQQHNNIWRYDAFVSYSSEDRFWVHDTFMKILEEKYGFRLCIHYRDFPVGGDIAETISEKMSESREIIIILSDIAIRSDWCQFELDEALLQIHRRNKRLIVIKLGKIKTQLLNSKIAHILDNHTFLEWSENSRSDSSSGKHKLFWNTLVALLYGNPYGQCFCCCQFGARSLGYQDIIDTEDDDTVFNNQEESDLSDYPAEAKECRNRAIHCKRRAKQAKTFFKTLEDVLEDEELPHWAYGPTPWPIDQLLKEDKYKFDEQVFRHATERVNLLIECLKKQHVIQSENHAKEMGKFEAIKQNHLCGSMIV